MTTFLDPDDVVRLTGAKRKATQARVLRANHIVFFLNAAGWPVVLRSAVEGKKTHEQTAKSWRSNAA